MQKNPVQSNFDYQAAINRWVASEYSGIDYENHIMTLQKKFMKYYANIFILNRKALKIQHAYFRSRAGIKRVVTSRGMKSRSSSSIFFRPRYGLNDSVDKCNSSRISSIPASTSGSVCQSKEKSSNSVSYHLVLSSYK